MLKLFQLREDYSAALILLFISLMISASLIAILGFFKTENHQSVAESFMVEISSNPDESNKDNVIELLKSNAYINDRSISFKAAGQVLDHFQTNIPQNVKAKILADLKIKDIILFSTNEFKEMRVRDEFMNAIGSMEGIFSMRNVGTYKSMNNSNHAKINLLPIAIIMCIISIFFSFAAIRSELKRKYAEMKMLSFSGVNDGVILSRLRGSVSLAVLKVWLITILLFFSAFHLLSQNTLRHISYIGIKDIIVALSIALVMMLIVLPMYTNHRAKKILNNF
ncbi:MAG: hypothetical protein HKN09_09245 [Saprospiraceae bacterium]|nr:hypothetical protein [Saprospiraceae bacterium]